jgi:hypothetical protein
MSRRPSADTLVGHRPATGRRCSESCPATWTRHTVASSNDSGLPVPQNPVTGTRSSGPTSHNGISESPAQIGSRNRVNAGDDALPGSPILVDKQLVSNRENRALPALRLGRRLPPAELSSLGFRSLDMTIGRIDLELTGGMGCEWTTVGDVPDAPGLYASTLHRASEDDLRVVYVGMTENLWMVTKGRLPRGGGARGGQRYGRPTHAGETRQRVNVEVLRAHLDGWTVRHWVRPLPSLPYPERRNTCGWSSKLKRRR